MNYIDYFTSYEYKFKRFVNDNVDSLSFNRNDLKPNVSKKNLQTRIQEDKLFLATSTDGKNDGKLSSKEKAKAFFGGMANYFIGFFDETYQKVKEKPVEVAGCAILAAGVGIAGIAAFGAPVVVGVLSVLGLILGAKELFSGANEIYKGIQKNKNAKTDAEAKQAFYDIGGGAGAVTEGAIAVASSSAGLKFAFKNVKNGVKIVKTSEEFFKNIDDVIKKDFDFLKMSKAERKAFRLCNKHKKNIAKAVSYMLKEYTDNQRKSLINTMQKIGGISTILTGNSQLSEIITTVTQGTIPLTYSTVQCAKSVTDNVKLSAKYMV